MNSRVELQKRLESLLGSRNVYYQPPESIKINYPAIIYTLTNIRGVYANDKTYLKQKHYSITVIDKKIDNPVIEKILEMPKSSFERHYVSDNLNHDVITLYY